MSELQFSVARIEKLVVTGIVTIMQMRHVDNNGCAIEGIRRDYKPMSELLDLVKAAESRDRWLISTYQHWPMAPRIGISDFGRTSPQIVLYRHAFNAPTAWLGVDLAKGSDWSPGTPDKYRK